jgi:hypothetical protein
MNKTNTQNTTRLSASSETPKGTKVPVAGTIRHDGVPAHDCRTITSPDRQTNVTYCSRCGFWFEPVRYSEAHHSPIAAPFGWQPAPQWAKDAKDQDAALAQAEQCAECHAPTLEECICDDLNHTGESKTWTGLQELVKQAQSWHDFHHLNAHVQCDEICAALPAAKAELERLLQGGAA